MSLGLPGMVPGEVGGSVLVNGTRDSLLVDGEPHRSGSGSGFQRLALEGASRRSACVCRRWTVRLHGCRLHGEVAYDRVTGSYSFDGVCEGLDITEGFLPEGGAPETDLNGSIRVEHDAVRKTFDVRAQLEKSVVAGFEGEEMRFTGRGTRERASRCVRSRSSGAGSSWRVLDRSTRRTERSSC